VLPRDFHVISSPRFRNAGVGCIDTYTGALVWQHEIGVFFDDQLGERIEIF